MKRSQLICAIPYLVSCAFPMLIRAELLQEEHFVYPTTQTLKGSAWTFQDNAALGAQYGFETSLASMQLQSTSLFKSGLKQSTGNKLVAVGRYETGGYDLSSAPNLFVSFLLRFDGPGEMGGLQLQLPDSSVTGLLSLAQKAVGSALTLHTRLVDGKIQLGISKSTGEIGGVTWNTAKLYDFGEVVFVVLNYESIESGDENDVVRAWVYSETQVDNTWDSQTPSVPTLEIQSSYTDRTVNQFLISWNPVWMALPNYSFDSLRVGTTFASVTPRTLDSDSDGLTDEAETLLQTLGFDPNVNNAEQVISLFVNPNNAFLYTYHQHNANRANGQVDVTTNPSAFNLFTQQQFNNNRTAGQSDVISNPLTYGLYTSNSIMDLRMNGLIVQKNGTNAVVSFQPQTTTDLTQPFTNNGTPITNTIPMPGNKGFIRINAKP